MRNSSRGHNFWKISESKWAGDMYICAQDMHTLNTKIQTCCTNLGPIISLLHAVGVCLWGLSDPVPCINISVLLYGQQIIIIKVNRYTYRESNSVIYIAASHINQGHLIKERICSHWRKFIPLRADPISGRLHSPGKQTGSHKNVLSLKPWLKKMQVYPYTLNDSDQIAS